MRAAVDLDFGAGNVAVPHDREDGGGDVLRLPDASDREDAGTEDA